MPSCPAPPKSKPKAKRYHHGGLSEALRQAAVGLIAERGAVAFSLRELAQGLGVSHAAVYRHFPSKRAVLAAVAEEGYQMLLGQLDAAAAGAPQAPLVAIKDQVRAYLTFARQFPGHFRAMYHGELGDKDDFPTLAALADRAGSYLLDAVRQGQEQGRFRRGADTEAIALAYWALAHGMADLSLNRQFPTARRGDALMLNNRFDELLVLLEEGTALRIAPSL